MKPYLITAALMSTVAAPAAAAPQVAVDILPVHSLVSRVMEGVGEPTLVVPPGASPHGYAMRPSEAAAVEGADIVFFVGEELSPMFARSVDSLATNAQKIPLLDVPNAILLNFREGATFEAHDHGDDDDHGHGEAAAHDDHDDHGHEKAAAHDDNDHGHEEASAHDDHDDHGHEKAAAHDDHDHGHEEAAAHDDHDHGHEKAAAHDDHDHGHEEASAHDDHDDHGHEKAAARGDHDHDDHAHEETAAAHDDHDHHGHDHDGVDPHAWLDPMNAKVWVDAIAAALSQADPENASTYFGNAAAAKGEYDALIAEVTKTVEPIRGRGFVVFHDAYHYFEARFDTEAAGAISLGDAAQPSAARIAEIKDAIADMDAACVFSEPQFEPRLVDTVIEGTSASKGVLDPLGANIEPGPDFYPTLIQNIADSLVGCLRPQT
ncbi:MAG: zinc ABC transporter substrate-binding protein [Pseudomonadota bacterium]